MACDWLRRSNCFAKMFHEIKVCWGYIIVISALSTTALLMMKTLSVPGQIKQAGITQGRTAVPNTKLWNPMCVREPVRDIVYVKIQKTASTTLRVMLLRYALKNHLTVCLDAFDFYHLGWPDRIDLKLLLKPMDRQCNLIAEEMIYDKVLLDEVTNDGRVYITSIKHPIDHFLSMFKYSSMHDVIQKMAGRSLSFLEAVRLFLLNPKVASSAFHANPSLRNFYRKHIELLRPNLQLFDLGMEAPEMINQTVVVGKINNILGDFTTVIMSDYFDQSMVILKEDLCWNYNDLIYAPMNSRRSKTEKAMKIPDDLKRMIAEYNRYDMLLYDIAKRVFDKRVARDSTFDKKVAKYRSVIDKAKQMCSRDSKTCFPCASCADQYFANVQQQVRRSRQEEMKVKLQTILSQMRRTKNAPTK